MESVLLSVIIPVYNLETYINGCLDSIQSQLDQQDFPVEILLVDDGSTDQSKEKIQPYLTDSHFKYIYQENTGVSGARNNGLLHAKGQFITFVDGDDSVSENYFSVILSNFDPSLEMLCFNYREYSESTEDIPLTLNNETIAIQSGDGINGFLRFQWQERIRPFVFNKVYKKDILDQYSLRFDENKKIGEDTLFNAAYIERIHSMKMVDPVLYHYRLHPQSAIHRYHPDFVDDAIQYIDSFTRIAEDNGVTIDPHDLEAFYLSRWFGCINNESRSDNFQSGWKQLKRYLNEERFQKNLSLIRFTELPKKLKIYYVLLRLHLTFPIYALMYAKNH